MKILNGSTEKVKKDKKERFYPSMRGVSNGGLWT